MAYIYEHIRTRGYEPIHFERHYTHLKELAQRMLHTPLKVDRNSLKAEIAETLRRNRYSERVTNSVKVCFDANEITITSIEEVLYNDFAVRAIRPTIGDIERVAKGSSLLENCSAKEAMREWHYTRNLQLDYPNSLTIWATNEDEVVAIDGSPVIAVFEGEIRFAEGCSGVEFDLAYEVASRGRNARRASLMLSELAQAKELLFVDHRGITAIESWGERLYMDITASHLASMINVER